MVMMTMIVNVLMIVMVMEVLVLVMILVIFLMIWTSKLMRTKMDQNLNEASGHFATPGTKQPVVEPTNFTSPKRYTDYQLQHYHDRHHHWHDNQHRPQHLHRHVDDHYHN